MGEWIYSFADWMTVIPPLWAYLVILLVAWLENIVPPIPGDIIIVFGGYLVGIGHLQMVPTIILSTIGGAVGFMCVYWLGVTMGDAVFDRKRYRWLPKREMRKARVWIHRWGYGAVLANRFLTGARSVISLAVGIAKMRPWRVGLYATLSALVWTSLMVLAGYYVGQNWEVVAEYLENYGIVVGALLLVLLLGYVARRLWKQKQN